MYETEIHIYIYILRNKQLLYYLQLYTLMHSIY